MAPGTYLLSANHYLLQEVHGAVVDRREVELAFDCEDVVEVALALHRPGELAAADLDHLGTSGDRHGDVVGLVVALALLLLWWSSEVVLRGCL